MKIRRVIIAHYYQPSSAATNRIIAYANGFAELGVEVVLVLGSEKELTKPVFGSQNVKVVGIKSASHQLLWFDMGTQIKKYYKKEDSVILVYGSPLLCLWLSKAKYNIFYECTEIPFYGRKKTLCARVKEIIKVCLARRATGMLVISKALVDYFKEQGIKNITVINMFVDFKRFENVKTDTEEKYIAYCGTISPFKDGVDCLIKAFAIFASSHSDYNLKIIGKFESEDVENILKRLVENLKISNKVVFTGIVKPIDMPQLLCGAQMLALARPNNEQAKYGFPTKLGEYLATGKPVVVTRVGEIGNFLKDGVNCCMSKPESPNGFADCMSWVADHYNEALKLGTNGKKLTKIEFSSVEQSKRALTFMEQLMNRVEK